VLGERKNILEFVDLASEGFYKYVDLVVAFCCFDNCGFRGIF
jgi:hypothetical protein